MKLHVALLYMHVQSHTHARAHTHTHTHRKIQIFFRMFRHLGLPI
uniref:Uncharacterized protein n=1 Tax=Anguilla anguilla TaxID=7936 RepID=A0A0E9T2C3_ANGAN